LKIKQEAEKVDKKLFERSEFFLSVDGGCVVFSSIFSTVLSFLVRFWVKPKMNK
jgi:hypothetical protein